MVRAVSAIPTNSRAAYLHPAIGVSVSVVLGGRTLAALPLRAVADRISPARGICQPTSRVPTFVVPMRLEGGDSG